MDFATFWSAYEDVVRKARNGKLTVDDFAGTTHLAHQPGHHRHQPLGAAADEGPGLHHRRRVDGLPGRVPGRVGADADRPRGQQGDDPDVDLRPPDHPGRAVRRVPAAHPPAAAGRGRLLRRGLRRAADPVRADPLEPGHLDVARRRHQQAGAGAGAHPRLPRARPHHGRHRPAGVPPAQPPRPRRRHPRPDPVGPRPGVRDRVVRRHAAPVHEAAPRPRHPARLVLPHRRHRVHAHPGPRAAPLAAGTRRAGPREAAARGAAADPAQAQPGRGVRDVPADEVRRPEALQPRGRRDHAAGARRAVRGGRGGGARRGLHRHGAPRPAQRAGQHRRQEPDPGVPRVRGQHRPAHGAGLGRREVPPRRRGPVHGRQRRHHQGVGGRQPVAPRGGRPGARGDRPRQAGPAEPGRRLPGAAAARARRCGVRRPGRGGRDAEPLAAARLPYRRQRPRRRQQPGGVHHLARVVTLVAVLHRRRPDGPGADLPRQR